MDPHQRRDEIRTCAPGSTITAGCCRAEGRTLPWGVRLDERRQVTRLRVLTYGFTWLAGLKGSNHRAPSHAYKNWKHGDKARAQILTETGHIFETELQTRPVTDPDIEPVELAKRLVSADAYLPGIEPQTVSQGIGLAGGETEQRKQANPLTGAFLALLREQLTGHLAVAEPGEQSTLARELGIHGGTPSKFLNGRGLSDRHATRHAGWADANRVRPRDLAAL
ncbi:MAG: hypothetical protein V4579_06645 [Pseudomonadota bacterium]